MPEYMKLGTHLKVKDFFKSLDFYLKLGFKPVFAYGDEQYLAKYAQNIPHAAERYRGMTFEIGGGPFEIADGHVAVKPDVFKLRIESSKVSAMIDVDSIEKIINICERNGFEIAKGRVKYPWGTEELVVRDPDGFIIVFREFSK
ncbi:MAG: VOC family protein [Candidatus Doudnabacteria bacterium]|nr:VOC family protein [Candidatus Doudnabacteria bacterium]